ncbi:hypothetical protein NMG60_11029742 [Bertholletia excelsa]
MGCHNLQIRLLWARDLHRVNLIGKMDVYVVVSIPGDPNTKQQRTPIDKGGDTNPTWDFSITFAIDDPISQRHPLNLVFTLRCHRNLLGDTVVGEVSVPLRNLPRGGGGPQFVTYQVRKPSGKPKGELSFSYKWIGNVSGPTVAPPQPMNVEESATAYPAAVMSPCSLYPPPAPPKEEEPVIAYPTSIPEQYPPAPLPDPYSYLYPYPPPPAVYPVSPTDLYPYQPPPTVYPPSPAGVYPPEMASGYGYPLSPCVGYPLPAQPGYGYPQAREKKGGLDPDPGWWAEHLAGC